MKATALVLALFVSTSQAGRLRFFDLPSEENAEIISEAKKMNQVDSQMMEKIDQKLDQAQRNANQGELGRTLAMNKINEIKLSLSQVKENFEKEASHATSNGLSEEDPMYTLATKEKNVNELSKKAMQFEKRLPQVQELEVTLGLPENVQDSELAGVKSSMEKALDKARAEVRKQAVEEAKVEDDKKPKIEEKWIPVNE